MHTLIKSIVFTVLGFSVMPAWATAFSATLPDEIGPKYGGYVFGNVTSPGTTTVAAVLTFDLIGYGGLDGGWNQRVGTNDVSDFFTFTNYDDTYFTVSLNMGGAFAGTPIWGTTDPDVSLVSYTDNGSGLGGLAQFKVNFSLLPGVNTFVFQYSCCSPANGNGTEEGWGLRNVMVTADLPAVPEPASWGLMIAGLGLLGWRVRNSKML